MSLIKSWACAAGQLTTPTEQENSPGTDNLMSKSAISIVVCWVEKPISFWAVTSGDVRARTRPSPLRKPAGARIGLHRRSLRSPALKRFKHLQDGSGLPWPYRFTQPSPGDDLTLSKPPPNSSLPAPGMHRLSVGGSALTPSSYWLQN